MQRAMAKLICMTKALRSHYTVLPIRSSAPSSLHLPPCTKYSHFTRAAKCVRALSRSELAQQPDYRIRKGHAARCHSLQQARQAEANSLIEPAQSYCSGCGVKFQQEDPDVPGYFRAPKQKELVQKESVITEEDEAILRASSESSTFRTSADLIDRAQETSTSGRGIDATSEANRRSDASTKLENNFWQGPDEVAFSTEIAFESDEQENEEPVLLCARCYSLQHYGKVKSQAAEAALPAFDLGKKVGQKIALQKFRTPIVLCVVDVADFDGSLPRQALISLLPRSMYGGSKQDGGSQNGYTADSRQGGMQACKFIVACNKADLLPKQASLARIQGWVKKRLVDAGLPTPSSVHMISSLKQLGVKDLLSELQSSAGPAGDVWVVGAQNAGKSSLINAMRRVVGKKSTKRDVTTAALPGTTLGMLRIDGIMTGRNRMFDTPGVPHDHQLSARLTADEVKLLLSRGRLVPRTFRASVGQTILIGGLARIDVTQITKATLYLTVWASSDLKCHYGKTEGAEERYEKMAGSTLVPPIGPHSRVEQLGPLIPSLLRVEGQDWKGSSTDVAIAGLGWVGIGLSGAAELRIWVHKGVAVTRRQALIPDYSAEMQRPGLTDKALKAPKAAKKR